MIKTKNIPNIIKAVKPCVFSLLFVGVFVIPIGILAQEEEDASVYLEEYSDEFQEAFFSALQQKGIKNYDRAINYLQKCIQLQPDQSAVYHEMARIYRLDRQFALGFPYAAKAVRMEPDNYWYTDTYWYYQYRLGEGSIARQGEDLSFQNDVFWSNMARISLKRNRYDEASGFFKRIKSPNNYSQLSADLEEAKAKGDPMTRALTEALKQPKSTSVEAKKQDDAENPVDQIKKNLRTLQQEGEFSRLYKESTEANENYPLQPDFYYYKGWALLKQGKAKEATTILEESLDYLLEEGQLSLFIYQALAEAYELLGEPEKLKYYQKKLNENNPN